MPDASPAKWHLAHTSWFFETFVLARLPDFRAFSPEYRYLFNSYYDSVGARHPRPTRGLLTRPSLREVLDYRADVTARMARSIDDRRGDLGELGSLIELGIHHEQQHQELILTDIKHLFAQNPLRPAYVEPRSPHQRGAVAELSFQRFDPGVRTIGAAGSGFAFDNECPRHRQFLEPFELASRLVSNGEYLEFIRDGGYQRPELWLSDGFRTSCERGWRSPLYFEPDEGGSVRLFTLSGLRELSESDPVCHLSYYEADAYARWAGARLPTEFEWERAAAEQEISGNLLEQGDYHPRPWGARHSGPLGQLFGDTWEWTSSSYLPYPGYRPAAGAVGEYNGKFMCNQFVLRGGSCVTPKTHIRATYRNYFPPDARWQFSGLRLARSI